MSLEKKAIARVVVYDPATRRNFWQGTVYRNGIQTPSKIVELIKEALGGLKENKPVRKKETVTNLDPPWASEDLSKSIETDKGDE